MDNYFKKCCPNCSQIYHLNYGGSKTEGNIPLFLSCGHSMCEKCILNITKCVEPIECKVCNHSVEVNTDDALTFGQNKSNLYQRFPINYLMVGEMIGVMVNKSAQGPEKCKKMNQEFEENFVDLTSLLKSTDYAQGKCLECHNTTSKMCQQCATILCDTCFNKTHKNFVIFKNHVHQNIETASMTNNNCKIHSDKPLDYYCKDCQKPICMDCMMVGEKSCKNHNVVAMQEVNENFLTKLSDVSPQVDEVFRRLTKTAVDIGYLLYNFDNENGSASHLNKIVFSIEQHFSKLLSTVQKHKHEVIDTVLKIKNTEKESLMSAKTDVSNAIKKAKQTMNMIEQCSDPKKLKQLNLASILEDAQQVVETPWYLNRDETDKDPLKLTVNEDLCSLINDYIHLEGNVKSDYKLYATKDLDKETEIPAAPSAPVYPPELAKDVRQTQKPKVEKEPNRGPMLYKNAPKYRSKCGSVSSLNSNSSDSYITQNEFYQKPIVHTVPPFPESQHPAQLYEGSQELVYICHIVNPHNFYVQRACHQGLVKEMLREFRNAVSLPTPSINHISEGKIYLMFNKTDNMWQRCRVLSIDKSKVKPLFQVFCFDFGSTETVSVDRLRLLPPARVQSPYPLALNCSLANCEPKNGTWTNDDSFFIQNITDNKQAVIHVRRIISTSNTDFKLDCDVITFEHGVNLAHALAFHERARLPDPKLPYPRTAVMNEKAKIFMDNNSKPESVEEVYITNIVSPDKFFVRKRHLQNVYDKMSEEMEQEYNLSTKNGTVYLPEIGMVCVVNIEKYRTSEQVSWARCVVRELPGRGRARVFLPDTGALHLVHWTALRYISHKFTTLRALATECHLAGITPLHKKWSVASVALLQNYENRVLELHVEECRARGSIGVTLYDKSDEENIVCLNREMIKHKHAISFGIYMFNKEPIEKQEITSKTPCDVPKQVPRKNSDDKKIKILTKQPSAKVSDEDELEARDKGPLRLEATVLQCQSPSLIYVSLVHQHKTFNELFEMIQKYYSKNKTPGKADWRVGDRCCTLCTQSQTWRRAVVLELYRDTAKVFYSDFACTETVPTSSLKELTSEFAGIGDAAIKCHLCGVIPAVGEEWPSLTKEYLKELIDVYQRVFITKLGNFKDKSMPVEIWVYHTIQGGALEPNRSEWRCLNTKIIEQGLGVPDKSQLVQPVATNTEGEGDDMLSFLNVTGSVNQWLQLDPIPTAALKTTTSTHVSAASSSPFESDDNTLNPNDGGEESPNVVFVSDWLPPEPLPCKEFTGVPTYIDNDGVIFLHDISQQDTLDLIRKALDVRFKDPDPKAKYVKWTVGEPCIALFFLDNRFYRGRVLEVDHEQGNCLIHYIDYGNEEVCAFTNLRKSVPLHQVPTQAHKCVLNRIRPVGKHWDRQTLDYIHKSIVEKQCYVKVAGGVVNGVIPIELKYDKLCINDHLVDFEMAEYTDGSKAVVKKFAPVAKYQQETEVTMMELDPGPEYIVEDDLDTIEPSVTSQESLSDICSLKGVDWNKLVENEEEEINASERIMTYPKMTEEEFVCNIGLINVLDMLELSIVSDEETTAVYEQMFEEIQKEAPDMPPIKNIYEYKPCVAIFPADGLWYRASVLEYSEVQNKIKVRYVDYGNIDVIYLSDAREINEEWVKLAPVTISAKLHGLELNPEVDIKIVTQEYADVFLDKGPFHAKIINYENPVPTVELRNESGELTYERLIENNVLRASQ